MSDETTDPEAVDDGPAVPEASDYRLRTCGECGHYARRFAVPPSGECRSRPPIVLPVARECEPYKINYLPIFESAPACSEFVTPAEWEAYRGHLARLLADPDKAEVVSAALSRP